MSKVTECAQALGQAIVESEEYKNMQTAEAAAMSDSAITDAMARYLEVKKALGDLMCTEDPDAEQMAAYGKEMDELQQKINEMPAAQAMTTARQEFSQVMDQVNKILEFMITGEIAESGGCSGNCGSCGGCH